MEQSDCFQVNFGWTRRKTGTGDGSRPSNLVVGATAPAPACRVSPHCCYHTLLTRQLLGWATLPAEWHLPAWGNGAISCHWINLPYDRQTNYSNAPGAQWLWLAFIISSMHAASITKKKERNQVYLLGKHLFAGLSAKGHFGFLLLQLELLRPQCFSYRARKHKTRPQRSGAHRWDYVGDLIAKSHADVDKYRSKSSRSVQFSYKRFLSL